MPSDTNPPLSPDSTRLYAAVDRSNETYEPSPHAPRRTPPSGRVSPDGKRAWPESSLTTKIVVFGGMGIVAAAATAGAVLAVRTVVDAIAGSDEDDAVEAARQRARARRNRPSQQFGPRPSSAMRFADGGRADHDDRRDRERADRERTERMRREAERRRGASSAQSQGSVVDSVNETVASLTSGVRDVLDTVTAAIEGFRSVAEKAGGVMADFNKAADQVKSMIEPVTQRRPDPGGYARPAKKDVVDLRDDRTGAQAAGAQGADMQGGGMQGAGMQGADAQDARSHRL